MMKGLIASIVLVLASMVRGDAAETYKRGVAVYDSDPSAAFALFEEAATEEHISAMVGLATCYEQGWGVKIDYALALEWYEKAARQNSLKGIEGLARIYASCPDPVFHDGEKSLRFATALLRKRPNDADTLDLFAIANLRAMRPEEAVRAGSKAVKYARSFEQAQVLTAKMVPYEEGRPVPAEATDEWIMQAAQKNVEWAVVKLARLAMDPAGELYSPGLAVVMCEKAVAMGRTELYLEMGRVHFSQNRLEEAYESFLSARKCGRLNSPIPIEIYYYRYLKYPVESVFAMAGKLKKGYMQTVSYMATETRTEYDMYGNPYTESYQVKKTREEKVPPNPAAARFLYEIAGKMGHTKAEQIIERDYNDDNGASGTNPVPVE